MFCAHSIGVVQASGNCLREVLAGKTMSSVLAKLEEDMESESLHWVHYLHPFKPQKKKRVREEAWAGRVADLTGHLCTCVASSAHVYIN